MSISQLNPLEVLLSLLQLRFAVEDERFGRLNPMADVLGDLGYDLNLVSHKFHLKNALSAQQGVLEVIHFTSLYFTNQVGMD